jgi:voltage-gated sodium channel
MLAVITLNAIVLGAETYGGVRDRYGDALHLLNEIFLGFFVVELVIRLVACWPRPGRFFSNGWNVFDFVVVVASFLPGLRENATLLRLLRLARIVRAVRFLPDLRVVLAAVVRSVPGVSSLAVMTLLLVYLYGMVGWVIFHDHDPGNFGNVGQAMVTMFVLLTLENLPTYIERGQDLSDWTLLFYLSYVLVASFLIFNLFIGIVINSMEEARRGAAPRPRRRARRRRGERRRRGRPRGRRRGPHRRPAPRAGRARGRAALAPARRSGDGDGADDGRRREHHARRVAERPRAPAVGEVERHADQRPADEAADVAADGDVADRQGEDQVEDDQRPDAGLERVDPPRAQLDRRRAHEPEDRARGADRGHVGLDEQRPERAAQQRRQVKRGEAQGAQRGLEHLPEDPQQVHVEADVDDVGVQEAAGDQPPVLVVGGDRRTEQLEVREEPVARGGAAEAEGPAGEEDDDTRDDDRDRDPRLAAYRAHRVDLRPLAGALRAAHAHRRGRHAVRADRAPARGAGDAGLPAGVAVARGHRGA